MDAARDADRADRRRQLIAWALDGRAEKADALLADDPEVARGSLAVALLTGDAAAVRAALDADPAVLTASVPDAGPRRPLSVCCHSAYLRPSSPRADAVRATIALLLTRGADPDETFPNEYGDMSVLYGAAGVAHDPEATRMLLAAGADPDDGESVYHAVEAPDTTCLELLLAAGATVRGTNALGNAIRDPAKVRVLLEHGDLRPTDPELRDALLHTRRNAVAELLIAHGADVDAVDREGLTPYLLATRIGDPEMQQLLLAHGATPARDPVADWLGAVLTGDNQLAAALLDADPALPTRLRHGDAELLPMMAGAGETGQVERLLDAGVPIDSPGVDHGTGLCYAGLWGRDETLRVLIERGADLHTQRGPGDPLGWTCWGSRTLDPDGERTAAYVACAEQLVAAGAEVRQGQIDVASDEVAVLLEQVLAERSGGGPAGTGLR